MFTSHIKIQMDKTTQVQVAWSTMATALGKWVCCYWELGMFGTSVFKAMRLCLQKSDFLLNSAKLPDLSVQILKKIHFSQAVLVGG